MEREVREHGHGSGDLGGASVRNRRREPVEGDGADRWGRRVSFRGEKEKKKEVAGRCGR
jgi:hypothetical protein